MATNDVESNLILLSERGENVFGQATKIPLIMAQLTGHSLRDIIIVMVSQRNLPRNGIVLISLPLEIDPTYPLSFQRYLSYK